MHGPSMSSLTFTRKSTKLLKLSGNMVYHGESTTVHRGKNNGILPRYTVVFYHDIL